MSSIDLSGFSVAELDDLIARATKLRAQMQPAPAAAPPEKIEVVFDPAWRSFTLNQSTILILRHAALGWVGFAFPAHERANLLTVFLRHALTPATTPATRPATPTVVPPTTASGGSTVH
jgi:hypothetical protein